MTEQVVRLNAALSGRYSVERQLGEGGMASVYLAEDLRHGRSVALKVLKPELAAVVGAERFLAEIRTTANLQHPHILPLFDSGQADGVLFYVMPHVDGESLRDRLDRERQLPVDEAIRIATTVAEALDYAHSRGVIHRDIKPANILLQAGKPVISDFGIALAVSAVGGGRLTETGLSLGTPHYMSPEQATGDVRVGPATDVYALGCVLYEMLVGEPPYTGSTPQAILGKIIAGEGVSATKQRARVPANVDAAIKRALEKVPADRFASAGDFAAALASDAFRHGAPTPAASPRASTWRTASLVAMGVALGAVTTWGLDRSESAPVARVMRFGLPTAGADALDASRGGQDVAISPDGSVVAYVGRTADGSRPQIYLRRLDQLVGTPLLGGEGGLNPTFTPDGRHVAFIDALQPATLKRVPVAGGPAETMATFPAASIQGIAWGPVGEIIVGTGGDTGLYRVPAGGGAPESIALGQYHWPAMIEGRNALLFMDHARNEADVTAMDLGTGEVTQLGIEGTSPRYLETGHLVFARIDGSLHVVPFDAARLAAIGDPVLLLEGVLVKAAGENAADYDISRDGSLIYAQGSGADKTRLVRLARDGGEATVVEIVGDIAYPRFSPDGSRIVYALGMDLWVLDVVRGARTRITFGGNNRYVPLWTPDGSRVTHAAGTDAENLVVASAADGSGAVDTLITLGPRKFPTSWSPDGGALSLTTGPQGSPTNSRDLGMLSMAGTSGTFASFVETPFNERGAVFSPDGRWVAYVSDRSGRDEIYARPYPGPGAEVTLSVDGGQEPVWSRSGTELVYRHQPDFMVVSVRQEAGRLQVGSAERLLADRFRREPGPAVGSYAYYDMAADGDLLVVDALARGEVGLVVVLNWLEELRARVAR